MAYHHELELLPKPTKDSGLIPDELLQRYGGDFDEDNMQEVDLDGVDLVEERDVIRAFQQQIQDIALND